MMEQLGKEPSLEELPPGYEDFPDIVIEAIIPGRGKNSLKQKRSFNLDRYPSLIFENGIMEDDQKNRIFKKIYKDKNEKQRNG